MRSGDEGGKQSLGESEEEVDQLPEIVGAESCESWERRSLMSVEGWRDSPDAAFACAEFGLLLGAVFDEAIGWVCDNGVDAGRGALREPLEAVRLVEGAAPILECGGHAGRGWMDRWDGVVQLEAIATWRCSFEGGGCIQAKVGANRGGGECFFEAGGNSLLDFFNACIGGAVLQVVENGITDLAGLPLDVVHWESPIFDARSVDV